MTRNKSLLAFALAILMMLPATAAFASGSYRWVEDCRYYGWVGQDGYDAISWTFDDNDGCRLIDADVRYRSLDYRDTTVYTKYCASQNAWLVKCEEDYVNYHSARNRAQDWEKWHWGSTGWRV